MVTMFKALLVFIISINEARVVDLPLPVGPVTRTRPLDNSHKLCISLGSPSCSNFGMVKGTALKAADNVPLCFIMLPRKRAIPLKAYEKSNSSSLLSFSICSCVKIDLTRPSTSSGVSGAYSVDLIFPLMRIAGENPAIRCKSDACFSTVRFNKSIIVFLYASFVIIFSPAITGYQLI